MSRTLSGCGLVAALALSGAASAADKPAPAYAVVGRIAGPDGGWDLLDIASARHRLYVARTTGVMAVDLDTLAVTPTLLTTQRGHSAMPIPGTTQVISTDGATNTATLFEGATGAVVATLKVGTKPDAVAWDPSTRTVWVMNADSGDISVIDPVKPKVVATVGRHGRDGALSLFDGPSSVDWERERRPGGGTAPPLSTWAAPRRSCGGPCEPCGPGGRTSWRHSPPASAPGAVRRRAHC